MSTSRDQQREAHLSDLVKAGKLTEAQKSELTKLHEKMDAKRDELREKGLTRDEMHTQMSSLRDEMQKYIESQKLTDVLPRAGRGEGMRGGGRGMGRGMRQ